MSKIPYPNHHKTPSLLSFLLGSHIKVETIIGPVEGKLTHVDYEVSHNGVTRYPWCVILQNEHRLMIVRNWQIIKKAP